MTPQPNIIIADAGGLAWAMPKDNPQFKNRDQWVKAHAAGTSFGNGCDYLMVVAQGP